MSDQSSSPLKLRKRIYQYYSKRGIASLLRSTVPFLLRRVVERRMITADKLVEQSTACRSWRDAKENSISISEPSDQRLQREFEYLPTKFRPRVGTVYEIENCDLVGPHSTALYDGKHIISESVGLRTSNYFIGSKRDIVSAIVTSLMNVRPRKKKRSHFLLFAQIQVITSG